MHGTNMKIIELIKKMKKWRTKSIKKDSDKKRTEQNKGIQK